MNSDGIEHAREQAQAAEKARAAQWQSVVDSYNLDPYAASEALLYRPAVGGGGVNSDARANSAERARDLNAQNSANNYQAVIDAAKAKGSMLGSYASASPEALAQIQGYQTASSVRGDRGREASAKQSQWGDINQIWTIAGKNPANVPAATKAYRDWQATQGGGGFMDTVMGTLSSFAPIIQAYGIVSGIGGLANGLSSFADAAPSAVEMGPGVPFYNDPTTYNVGAGAGAPDFISAGNPNYLSINNPATSATQGGWEQLPQGTVSQSPLSNVFNMGKQGLSVANKLSSMVATPQQASTAQQAPTQQTVNVPQVGRMDNPNASIMSGPPSSSFGWHGAGGMGGSIRMAKGGLAQLKRRRT